MVTQGPSELRILEEVAPFTAGGTLLLSFTGWMDGGDVSTGTVRRLVALLEAKEFARIDPEPFYIFNFPGSMELTALFRPHIEIEEGLVKSIDMPENKFYVERSTNLVLFIGKEPNLHWGGFADCIFALCERINVRRILFVGSFSGAVPHTREPRIYVVCSEPRLMPEMRKYGLRRTGYSGPGSFTSYLMTRAPSAGLEMASLVAEIPSYVQGTNPVSIEAVTRRLAKILKLPLALDSLRQASTRWELEISSAIEQDEELVAKIRELEERYDNELLEQEQDLEI
jgi:predicted ATP-grasp superfamily ATP-dependent carboligase